MSTQPLLTPGGQPAISNQRQIKETLPIDEVWIFMRFIEDLIQ
jgi:hypothetical protein